MSFNNDEIRAAVQKCPPGSKVALITGRFNVLHPGHVRLFNFAKEIADFLLVGVEVSENDLSLYPVEQRLEAIKAMKTVDASLSCWSLEKLIDAVRPDYIIKGGEFANRFNIEKGFIDSFGGELIFAPGTSLFVSQDTFESEQSIPDFLSLPKDYMARHSISKLNLQKILEQFKEANVLILGDLIMDKYVLCHPVGLSRETVNIVFKENESKTFIGGGGVVACHAKSLGASTTFMSVVGNDQNADLAQKTLESMGIEVKLYKDNTRPTSEKVRYKSENTTHFRLNHFSQHSISEAFVNQMIEEIEKIAENLDAIIIADFNYGVISDNFKSQVCSLCKNKKIPFFADCQSSSQVGNIAKYNGAELLTPTEHEARVALADGTSNITVLAKKMREITNSNSVFITLGADGVLIDTAEEKTSITMTDQLPSLGSKVEDVSGAGDCLLIVSALATIAGASIWESALLGSVAAAFQVSKVGNIPITPNDIAKAFS